MDRLPHTEMHTDILCSEKMNAYDFGDLLTFAHTQPAGASFHLSSEKSQNLLDELNLLFSLLVNICINSQLSTSHISIAKDYINI